MSRYEKIAAPAAKVVSIMDKHFEDKTNSVDDTSVIAAALIEASPTDPAMIHKVLVLAQQRSDVHLTNIVLNALGLLRTHNPKALEFIQKNLNSRNRFEREEAIQAVGHLDRDVRGDFIAKHKTQFGQLATDAEIGPVYRTMAADALSNREMMR